MAIVGRYGRVGPCTCESRNLPYDDLCKNCKQADHWAYRQEQSDTDYVFGSDNSDDTEESE